MGIRGRPSKPGKRKNGKLVRPKFAPRDYGNDRVQALRQLFFGIRKNAEGKMMDVSDDIADAPGQLHAVGYFDEHGHEPGLIRDTMRDYAYAYWTRNGSRAPQLGAYEPAVRTDARSAPTPADSRLDLTFERMSRALDGMRYERRCLEALACDYYWRDDIAPFARCLVDERLIANGRKPDRPIELPGLNDKEMLAGALRATFRLIETGLQIHAQRRAA